MLDVDVIAAFESGSIDRRHALLSLFKLGYRASAAYAAIGVIDSVAFAQPAHTPLMDTRNLANKLQDFATNKDVLDNLKNIGQLPADQRIPAANAFVSNFGKPEVLHSMGLNPEGRRLSLRVFETPGLDAPSDTTGQFPRVLSQKDASPLGASAPQDRRIGLNPTTAHPTICASAGVGVCVSVGDDGT